MTVAELEQRMTAAEFYEWAAYYGQEPFGAPWQDQQSAWLIAHIMALVSKTPPIVHDFLMLEHAQGERKGRSKPQSEWTQDEWAAYVNGLFGMKYAVQEAEKHGQH